MRGSTRGFSAKAKIEPRLRQTVISRGAASFVFCFPKCLGETTGGNHPTRSRMSQTGPAAARGMYWRMRESFTSKVNQCAFEVLRLQPKAFVDLIARRNKYAHTPYLESQLHSQSQYAKTMPKLSFRRDSPEPGSPESTESDSAPDDIQQTSHSSASGLLQFASQLTSSFGGSTSKRRLPGGPSFGAASNTRDAKSRRREEAGSRRNTGGGAGNGGGWAEGKDKREKDDLVDIPLADHLRKGTGLQRYALISQ
jgi:hypothetical protein